MFGDLRSRCGALAVAAALALVALSPLPAVSQTLGDALDACVAAVRTNDVAPLSSAKLRSYDGGRLGFLDAGDDRVAVQPETEQSGRLWKCTVMGYDPRDEASVRTPWISRRQAEPELIAWFERAALAPDSAGMQMFVPGEHGLATCDALGGWLVTATTQVSFGVTDMDGPDLPIWITVNRARPGRMTACERMSR
jgi:hypothetical protein